jgi:glycosyltransferase involved in cell wall biosynthesis
MRRLIFITQQVDPGHPALAATIPKIRALAERVDEVIVLADRVLPGTLPANCRSLSFGARTKVGRGLRFEAALTQELARSPCPVALVAHMCPIYAVLAAPLARPLGVPVLLWFTHWKRTRTLEAAEKASTAIVSVDTRSFPIRSRKVVAIGHGIDLNEFPCRPDGQRSSDLRIAALGRYSRAKGLDTVIRAVGLSVSRGVDVRLEIHGPALSAAEREHRGELDGLVGGLDLATRVRLEPAVLRSEVPTILHRADCLVNNMEAGAPDKIVYEAGASCLPVIASNPVFDELLDGLAVPFRFRRDDPQELAQRIERVAVMTPEQRASVGRVLRERVAADHSVEHWAERILEVAER